jgi:hypothetical protein
VVAHAAARPAEAELEFVPAAALDLVSLPEAAAVTAPAVEAEAELAAATVLVPAHTPAAEPALVLAPVVEPVPVAEAVLAAEPGTDPGALPAPVSLPDVVAVPAAEAEVEFVAEPGAVLVLVLVPAAVPAAEAEAVVVPAHAPGGATVLGPEAVHMTALVAVPDTVAVAVAVPEPVVEGVRAAVHMGGPVPVRKAPFRHEVLQCRRKAAPRCPAPLAAHPQWLRGTSGSAGTCGQKHAR